MRTYSNRFYHSWMSKGKDLVSRVTVKETDLFIKADRDLTKEAEFSVCKYRTHIETYIEQHPDFKTTLIPWKRDRFAPKIVQEMIEASRLAQVGPMAAVAGAIAQFVGWDLLHFTEGIVIENGGDIFVKSNHDLKVSIFAGTSPLSNKIGIEIHSEEMPLGVCTSSGTVGHSLSHGNADAVTVISKSVPLADAAATSIGNLVRKKRDIHHALSHAQNIKGVSGVIIIIDDRLGTWGNVELTNV